jgi:hypothetical protein
MDYQRLLREHGYACVRPMSYKLIYDCSSGERRVGQRIFLCILLAVIAQRQYYNHEIELPDAFPSADLLDALGHINNDTLVSDTEVRIFLSLAVRTLVRHNSRNSESFEWMKIFKVAPIVDRTYSLLEIVERRDFGLDSSKYFCKSFWNYVKPCVDKVDDNHIYVRLYEVSFFVRLMSISYHCFCSRRPLT